MVIDDIFAVIAETTRREILTSLRAGDKAVGELVDELGVSQPTVSKHLKVLREAGLVSMRAQGQRRFYALESAPLVPVATWLAWFDVAPATPAVVPDHSTAGEFAPPSLAAVEANGEGEENHVPQQLGRSVGRAAGKAADLFSSLPKLRRRRE